MTSQPRSSHLSPDTVLIDASVQDSSPERARDIVNALSDEFVVMAAELETFDPNRPPPLASSSNNTLPLRPRR